MSYERFKEESLWGAVKVFIKEHSPADRRCGKILSYDIKISLMFLDLRRGQLGVGLKPDRWPILACGLDKNSLGGNPIPASPATLLAIVNQGPWPSKVKDAADIRYIDTNPEGPSRHEDLTLASLETLENPILIVRFAMKGLAPKVTSKGLDVIRGSSIDDGPPR